MLAPLVFVWWLFLSRGCQLRGAEMIVLSINLLLILCESIGFLVFYGGYVTLIKLEIFTLCLIGPIHILFDFFLIKNCIFNFVT